MRTIAFIGGLIAAALIISVASAFLMPIRGFAAECAGETVRVSWYGKESGNRTATGERFDGTSMTAAMPSRKYLGRHYRVILDGKSVDVRINDVGPAKWTGRGIDLSRAAAHRLGMIKRGVASVCLIRLR